VLVVAEPPGSSPAFCRAHTGPGDIREKVSHPVALRSYPVIEFTEQVLTAPPFAGHKLGLALVQQVGEPLVVESSHVDG
jgi:hypothetical protein